MRDTPGQVNAAQVELDSRHLRLAEVLARSCHAKHAQNLLTANVQYKEILQPSPSPVRFDDLPEEEKRKAILTARETLKVLLSLGYRILPPGQELKTGESAPITASPLIDLDASATVDQLASLWQNRDPDLWRAQPNLYLIAGKRMLSAGEPLFAYDILTEGVESMGGEGSLDRLAGDNYTLLISLLQQQALSLAQSDASEEANVILRSLRDRGMNDSETMGILGRTWKDMAMNSRDEAERKRYLRESFACYNNAFATSDRAGTPEKAYYTGINAAAVSHFAGDLTQSKEIAARVEEICRRILVRRKNHSEAVSFWLYASLGEASLLQDDITRAERWYRQAAEGCAEDIRALGSMRRQARLILEYAGRDRTDLDHCFAVPSVILFSGHIIDTPGRHDQRFPPGNEGCVRREIRNWLERTNGRIGFSSAACGADIIFLEEMLRRNGEINIVLPFDRESFIQTSVNVIPGRDWISRFARVVSKAREVKILSQYNENTLDDDLLFTNLYLYGTAQVRAERAGTDLRTLLVWDRSKAQSIAGTAALADLIESKGGTFDIINPLETGDKKEWAGIQGGAAKAPHVDRDSCRKTAIRAGSRQAYHHSFLPLMMADVKGYSRLDKREKLFFASNFMGEMAAVLQQFESSILGRKTQGDSLFLVFSDLRSCVDCARELNARTLNVDWSAFGISCQLTMRISLDAGPCYSYTDPISGSLDFCGDYIVRAARLEPVTPPGYIYASETFVAVAKAYDIKNIQFTYAGQVELPKGFGKMQAFHVK